MTERKLEIRQVYESAVQHFGFERACEILHIVLHTEVQHQVFTEQMAESIFTEFTAA